MRKKKKDQKKANSRPLDLQRETVRQLDEPLKQVDGGGNLIPTYTSTLDC